MSRSAPRLSQMFGNGWPAESKKPCLAKFLRLSRVFRNQGLGEADEFLFLLTVGH
jgi:hypothetical protein